VWSFSIIQKHFKKCDKITSKGYLSIMKNQKENFKKIQSIRVIIVVEEKANYESQI
jgi:hypothetical protein